MVAHYHNGTFVHTLASHVKTPDPRFDVDSVDIVIDDTNYSIAPLGMQHHQFHSIKTDFLTSIAPPIMGQLTSEVSHSTSQSLGTTMLCFHEFPYRPC